MTDPVTATGADADREATDGAARSDGPPPGIAVATVTAWFAEHLPAAEPPLAFRLIAGGRSNLTFAVTDAAGRRWVLRRPPTGHLLPTAHDMAREHRILSAVGPAGIPVPRTFGLCEDPSVTGAPFYVMEYVDGHILRADGEAAAAFSPEQRRAVSEHLVDTLADLHALDTDAVGLGDLGRRDGYLARQLKRWYAQFVASRDEHGGPAVPDVDVAHDLLLGAVPEQAATGIVHGDYRLDNTVIGDDGRVAAVLDWELCTLGDVLADVGQLLVYWTEPGEPSALLASATADGGFLDRAGLAERYAAASGRSLDQLDFYVAFAYWKLACILEGVYTRYVNGAMGADGFDYTGYPAAIADLAARARQTAERYRSGCRG